MQIAGGVLLRPFIRLFVLSLLDAVSTQCGFFYSWYQGLVPSPVVA